MDDLVFRLRKRAEIRRQIPGRKSVEEGQPDRIADLLEEAATEIERLRNETATTLTDHELFQRALDDLLHVSDGLECLETIDLLSARVAQPKL